MRAAWAAVPAALTACSVSPGVSGRVTSQGQPQPGLDVVRGSVSAVTDENGAFAWDTAQEGPVDVWLASDRVHTDFGCESPHAIVLPGDASPGLARIALLVRGVTEDLPDFDAHFTAAVENGRAEEVRRVDVEVREPTPTSDGARAWTLHVDVPPADRWALGLSTLVAAGEGQTVDQVLLLAGTDLRDGDVAAYDLYLSDETLRGWLAWDLSGPPGASSVELVETLDLGGLPVSVTTWRGPVRQPRLVPLVQRTAMSLPNAIEGRFTYGAAGVCASRSVTMSARFEVATGDDPAGTLRFPSPWPAPPLVEEVAEGVRFSGFPRDAARVTWSSSRWTGAGTGACGAVVSSSPVSTRGGSLAWSSGEVGGVCSLNPTWEATPP